jgi:hypothetical protein
MFAYLLEKLGEWIERSDRHRCIKFLSRASDLADLERRLHAIERDGHSICGPGGLHQ